MITTAKLFAYLRAANAIFERPCSKNGSNTEAESPAISDKVFSRSTEDFEAQFFLIDRYANIDHKKTIFDLI